MNWNDEKLKFQDPVTSYIHLYQDLLSSFGDSAHLVHGIPHYGHLQPLQAQVSIVCAHCPKIIWISHIKTKPVTSGTSATEYSTVHLYSIQYMYILVRRTFVLYTYHCIRSSCDRLGFLMGRFILFLPQYGRSSHFAKIYKFRFFPHSVPLRFPFGSSSVPIRFPFGSHSVPLRFPLKIYIYFLPAFFFITIYYSLLFGKFFGYWLICWQNDNLAKKLVFCIFSVNNYR